MRNFSRVAVPEHDEIDVRLNCKITDAKVMIANSNNSSNNSTNTDVTIQLLNWKTIKKQVKESKSQVNTQQTYKFRFEFSQFCHENDNNKTKHKNKYRVVVSTAKKLASSQLFFA